MWWKSGQLVARHWQKHQYWYSIDCLLSLVTCSHNRIRILFDHIRRRNTIHLENLMHHNVPKASMEHDHLVHEANNHFTDRRDGNAKAISTLSDMWPDNNNSRWLNEHIRMVNERTKEPEENDQARSCSRSSTCSRSKQPAFNQSSHVNTKHMRQPYAWLNSEHTQTHTHTF